MLDTSWTRISNLKYKNGDRLQYRALISGGRTRPSSCSFIYLIRNLTGLNRISYRVWTESLSQYQQVRALYASAMVNEDFNMRDQQMPLLSNISFYYNPDEDCPFVLRCMRSWGCTRTTEKSRLLFWHVRQSHQWAQGLPRCLSHSQLIQDAREYRSFLSPVDLQRVRAQNINAVQVQRHRQVIGDLPSYWDYTARTALQKRSRTRSGSFSNSDAEYQ